jgi:amidase
MTLVPLSPRYPLTPRFDQSALALAAAIRDGTLRSAELVEHCLSRVLAFDGTLSAFVEVLAETARREAEQADKDRARGKLRGPFHGVPTAIKDQHLIRFTRTQFGSRSTLGGLWSPVDDQIVRRIRAGGFVILGKTTMPDYGLLPITEPYLHPPTRNPWNPAYTAGGSSGGAGAALASGMVPVAPGSDGAGSIRIPSALNGLIGLKPTRGVVPDDTARWDRDGLVTVGPMGRCVEDVATLLDVLTPEGRGHYAERARHDPPKLRIGVVREAPFGELDRRLVTAVDEVAARLTDAGHTVVERPCPAGTVDEFIPIYQRLFANLPILAPGRLTRTVRWMRDQGRSNDVTHVNRQLGRFIAAGADAMAGLDIMLTPTLATLAPKVGAFQHLEPREQFQAVSPLGAFTALANLTGQPAISVPWGSVHGLPIGVQLLGHAHADGTLLALARRILADNVAMRAAS